MPEDPQQDADPLSSSMRRRKEARKLPFSKVGTLRFPSSKRMPARWVKIDLNTRSAERQAMVDRLASLSSEQISNLSRRFYPRFSAQELREKLAHLTAMPPAQSSPDGQLLGKALEIAATSALRELVCGEQSIWQLPPPSALISVTGGAGSLNMTDKQKLVFRRGLLSAARTTNAWIMTGGTNAGVMEMVGRMLQESSVEVPCIGVTSWGVVADKEEMAKKANGRVLDYNGKTKLGAKFEAAEQRVALDPNHSHFVLVDTGAEGSSAFGKEIALRSMFETCICTTSFGVDEEGSPLPTPPMVLLVVGGGPNTLETVKACLEQERPVVVFVDSGGAAKHMRDCWDNRLLRRRGDEAARADEELCKSFGLSLPSEWTPARYMSVLNEVCVLGEKPRGAMHVPQLTFFSTSDDVSAGNDLDMRILTSLLSDVEKTMEAVKLAVSWGEPTIIRTQLDQCKEHDKSGLAESFERALLTDNASVAETLIQYNAAAALVRAPRLWSQTLRPLHLLDVDDNDHTNFPPLRPELTRQATTPLRKPKGGPSSPLKEKNAASGPPWCAPLPVITSRLPVDTHRGSHSASGQVEGCAPRGCRAGGLAVPKHREQERAASSRAARADRLRRALADARERVRGAAQPARGQWQRHQAHVVGPHVLGCRVRQAGAGALPMEEDGRPAAVCRRRGAHHAGDVEEGPRRRVGGAAAAIRGVGDGDTLGHRGGGRCFQAAHARRANVAGRALGELHL